MNKSEAKAALERAEKATEGRKEYGDFLFHARLDLSDAVETLEDMADLLQSICTQYPLMHGEPVPAWIRNAQDFLKRWGEG